jgi:uncharacterized protein YjbI with pentapeptide repeats
MSLPPPTYSKRTGLSEFAKDLRSRLFDTQSKAAEYFGVVSSTIWNYEHEEDLTTVSPRKTTHPPSGYLAHLICLLVEKQKGPQVIENYKTVLLEEMNKALDQYPESSFFDNWDELKLFSDIYMRDNPYQGLFAFREQDAPFFFGREEFITHLGESVQRKPLVSILGPSGSGKSSIVFAGLVPRLQREGSWLIVDFRPGRDPFRTLTEALLPYLEPVMGEINRQAEAQKMTDALSQGTCELSEVMAYILEKNLQVDRILLIADQFEELYTLCDDANTRHKFLDMLGAAVRAVREPSLHFVVTLRADFLGQALLYPSLGDTLQDTIELLKPMKSNELRMAIEKPADLKGVHFEAGLVDRILSDVNEEPGYLPLLEFALTALWKRKERTRSTLTHSAYEDVGKVEGALSRHADKVFENLDEIERERARRVFLQLVQPGEGTGDTRHRATKAELGEVSWYLVQRLANERLVVTDQDSDGQETVEIAHEALIRGWKRLQGWIEADRAFLIWLIRLRFYLDQWKGKGQDEGALLRGALLTEAEVWLTERGDDLGQAERDFIQNSMARCRRREWEKRIRWAAGVVFAMVLLFGARGWWSENCPKIIDSCPRINPFGIELVGVQLSGADLRGADLRGKVLSGANLSRADLDEADLRGADLRGADLSETTNLHGVDLRGADLTGATLWGADLSEADLREAILSRINMDWAKLEKTKIDDTTQIDDKWRLVWEIVNQGAEGRNLSGADLSKADVWGANLRTADLSEADLREANLAFADLAYVNLPGANLRNANLEGAKLPSANLIGADLHKVNLTGANLTGANLTGANLTEVDLEGATLWIANLSKADLSGANLSKADLGGTDLTEAEYDHTTTWPKGFDPEEVGAKSVE